ncbi:uncharacterized protein ACNS7B_020470 isoform 1-T2 [Menidia menidia]
MVFQWTFLIILTLLERTGLVGGCVCPPATVLSQFPWEVPAGACCLNFSGSAVSLVHWSVFTNDTNLQTLDLSNCNISSIDLDGKESSTLQKVHLNGNRLTTLPRLFLSSQPSLTEVNLSENFLQELPEGFLRGSDSLQRLSLRGNRLRYLPGALLLVSSLRRLELDGNLWDCSCSLLEGLEAGGRANRTTKLQDLVGNLTCSSPRHLAGRTVWSVNINDACRPAGLTVLFIALPLVVLAALLLCWCCGRKRRKKETPAFSSSKKRASSCNGQKSHGKQHLPGAEQAKAGGGPKGGILKNLGSSRDIYEEVQVKLGSAESLPPVSSFCSSSTEGRQGSQEPDAASRTELDTVSVTEVMKDSADREKAYMTQSTEYYSLVPGIELEDSDHAEYESVDLS